MLRLHVTIRGGVQGVGFRYFVLRRARALGLTGWVRNRADGTVEVDAEGDRAALEGLLERLREGPPGATVAGVEVDWSTAETSHPDFEVK
jgi:acylphosphatase